MRHHLFVGQPPVLRCPSESRNPWNVFRSSAPPVFLRSAVQELPNRASRARIQSTDTLRTVNLVCRGGQVVDRQSGSVNAQLPNGLSGVHVQGYCAAMSKIRYLLDGLND